jgi:hypothetical protein
MVEREAAEEAPFTENFRLLRPGPEKRCYLSVKLKAHTVPQGHRAKTARPGRSVFHQVVARLIVIVR